MIDKGRQVRGSKCGNAKLDEEKVYYIKFVSDETDKELAEIYGVHPDTIRSIRNGVTWKALTEDYITERQAA